MGRLTEQDKKFIQENYLMTNKELAELLKHDRHTIGRYKEKLGVAFKQLHTFTEYNDYILQNYYTKTARELAQEIGCSKEYVAKVWLENGLSGKTNRSYYCDYNFFEVIDSEEKAYILGFIASDGNLYKREGHQGQISIQLCKDDKQILEDILKVMNSNHPVKMTNETCSIVFVSDKMFNDLIQIGITPKKTWNLDINLVFNNIPKRFWKDFIRGYIDGDGSINLNQLPSKSNISIAIPQSSGLQLLQKLKEITNEDFLFVLDKHHKYNHPFGAINAKNATQKYILLKLIYSKATIALKRKQILGEQLISNIENNITNRSENKTAVVKWGELLENLEW